MEGFKLLAIRPLEGCDAKFRKNLKEGVIYKFYQDYRFFDNNLKEISVNQKNLNEPIVKIESPNQEIDLYSQRDLKINISAVVGKNGSGKSSLIELLFAAIYNVGIQCQVLYNSDTEELFDLDSMLKDLKVEIIYELDGVINKLMVSDSILIKSFKKDGKINGSQTRLLEKKDTRKLFYSISINYSIYGLNSSEPGMDWIRHLFHKNDGYQTPLVINPMRTKGNIRIETESYLAKARLISNLLDPNQDIYNIGEDKVVDTVEFKLNQGKIEFLDKVLANDFHFPEGIISIDKFIENNRSIGVNVLEKIYEAFKIPASTNIKFKDFLDKYLIKKLYSVCAKYEDYHSFLEAHIETKQYIGMPYLKPHFNDFSSLLDKIKNDGSHITLKIRQTINYLKLEPLKETKKVIWKNNAISFPLKELKSQMKTILEKHPKLSVIELIPPSLFFYDMTFKKEGTENTLDLSKFNLLSSGEQQFIHSIQSIIYHIINLSSIFNKPLTSNRNSYQNVNLILDEVELYFHPEFQRTFINNLLNELKRLKLRNNKNNNGIDSVNILFSTHSPFILSDITSSNILRLIDGMPQPSTSQTFAANIYDILKDDFFLSKGVIGEFAKQKINQILNKSQLTVEDFKVIDLIGDPFLKGVITDKLNQKIQNVELLENQIIKLNEKLNSLKNASN